MIANQDSSLVSIKKSLVKRFTLASATLATAAVVAGSGVAGAAPAGKPTKAECQSAGFTNYGQCVKEWAHNKNHGGGGYGGDEHNENNIHANVTITNNLNHSNHNVITNVINFFFG